MHINFAEKFTVAFHTCRHGASIASAASSLSGFPSSLFPIYSKHSSTFSLNLIFFFLLTTEVWKQSQALYLLCPLLTRTGFLTRESPGWRPGKGPITLPSAEECELFHLYDKLTNPWSEMSSLTKHSKTITLSLSHSHSTQEYAVFSLLFHREPQFFMWPHTTCI